MTTCDSDGPGMMMITKIIVDEHAGEVAVGRLFSGKLVKGVELFISGRETGDTRFNSWP